MNPSRIAMHAVRFNAALAIALGICFFITSLYMWMRFHVHLPIRDTLGEWPFVQKVLEHGVLSSSLQDWIAPLTAAHRIAVIRLLMVVDFEYFGGQNHVIYTMNWLSILALLAVFARTLRQNFPSERAPLLFFVGLSLIFLTSHTQLWNLINPMNGSWYIASAACALSIYFIAKQSTTPPVPGIAAAYLFAMIAAYSNFAGVIAWLLLPVLLWLRSPRMGFIAALITALFLMFYLRGVHSDWPNVSVSALTNGAVAELSIFTKIAAYISNTCLYLGSPLSIAHRKLADTLVVFSFLVLAAGWAHLLTQRFFGQNQHNPLLETTLAIATLNLGVAFVTQMGRLFFFAPTNMRYQTIVMVYWLCICGLVLFFALKTRKGNSSWQFVATTISFAIAALLLANNAHPIVTTAKVAEAAYSQSALKILGVSDGVMYPELLLFNPANAIDMADPDFKTTRTAYWFSAVRQIDFDHSVECKNISLKIRPSAWPGISVARGRIVDTGSKWYRQIPVTTAQGHVIGFLSPKFSANVTQVSLFLGGEDAWQGYFRSSELPQEIYLHYLASPFSTSPCRLAL